MFSVSYRLGFSGRPWKAQPGLAFCYPAGACIDDGTNNGGI
jgi:hypothetical protein